jgi:hypothetical protein
VQAQHPQAEDGERECGAVVQARLAGEAETDPVAVRRVLHLNVGREHRVGGRKDRPEQYGGARWEVQQGDARRGDESHGDEHGQRREADGQPPQPVGRGQPQLQSRREQ